MRRICRGSLPLKAEIQAILCNPSRPGSQPRAQQTRKRTGVRGNRLLRFAPAAFRRFRRAKAASQVAGGTSRKRKHIPGPMPLRRAKAASQTAGRASGKRCAYLCSCEEEQLTRSPSVIGLRPLTAPSRREPWNVPGAATRVRHMPPSANPPCNRSFYVRAARFTSRQVTSREECATI